MGKTWKVAAGVAYEDFTDEGFNNGGGGVPFHARPTDTVAVIGRSLIVTRRKRTLISGVGFL